MTMTETYEGELPLRGALRGFQALCDQPRPLSLDGAALIGYGLPARVLALGELQELLLDEATGTRARNAVWREVVRRVQAREQDWALAAVGLAYPGLVGALRQARARGGQSDDIEEMRDLGGEILTEFLAAVDRFDVEGRRVGDVAGFLCSQALTGTRRYREARAADRAALYELPEHAEAIAQPAQARGLLERAVAAGVLDAQDAELLALSYLDGRGHGELARQLHVSVATFYRRRTGAVDRLADALRTGRLTRC